MLVRFLFDEYTYRTFTVLPHFFTRSFEPKTHDCCVYTQYSCPGCLFTPQRALLAFLALIPDECKTDSRWGSRPSWTTPHVFCSLPQWCFSPSGDAAARYEQNLEIYYFNCLAAPPLLLWVLLSEWNRRWYVAHLSSRRPCQPGRSERLRFGLVQWLFVFQKWPAKFTVSLKLSKFYPYMSSQSMVLFDLQSENLCNVSIPICFQGLLCCCDSCYMYILSEQVTHTLLRSVFRVLCFCYAKDCPG